MNMYLDPLRLFTIFVGSHGIEEAQLTMKVFLLLGFIIFLVSSVAGFSADSLLPYSLVGELEKNRSVVPSVDKIKRG